MELAKLNSKSFFIFLAIASYFDTSTELFSPLCTFDNYTDFENNETEIYLDKGSNCFPDNIRDDKNEEKNTIVAVVLLPKDTSR